jgi:hypothetical protein
VKITLESLFGEAVPVQEQEPDKSWGKCYFTECKKVAEMEFNSGQTVFQCCWEDYHRGDKTLWHGQFKPVRVRVPEHE